MITGYTHLLTCPYVSINSTPICDWWCLR